MRRGTLFLMLLLAVGLSIFVRWRWSEETAPQKNFKDTARVEPSPVCPWREPAQDLAAVFPSATNYQLETRIVTGVTVAIQKKLGRLMRPDENPLRIYRVLQKDQALGAMLVTRVKGEHGGIEIVAGVETNGIVRAVRIQSQREPAKVADAIINGAWLASFAGKSAASELRLGADLPDVPPEARLSAQAIADGVRELLIVLSFAEMPSEARVYGQISHH